MIYRLQGALRRSVQLFSNCLRSVRACGPVNYVSWLTKYFLIHRASPPSTLYTQCATGDPLPKGSRDFKFISKYEDSQLDGVIQKATKLLIPTRKISNNG